MTEEPVELPPNADLVIRFTRPVSARDVGEWMDGIRSEFPGRRIIALDHRTEFRIESKVARRTNHLLLAAVAVLIVDLVVRAFA